MKESSTVANYDVNVPLLIMNGDVEERATISLSPEDRRKVSFEDDCFCLLGYSSLAVDSNVPASMLKEENRVVSNDIIHRHNASELKSKSKSLPSLTRSGDLKALLEQSSLSGVPTVSEGSLSSESHHDEGMIHKPQNDSWAQTTEPMHAHTSCTGWGQFVDFLPLQSIGESPQGKQVCPRRRRSRSFCTSSRYRQYSKSRVNLNHKKRTEQGKTRQGTSSPLYNRKKSAVSTNEMAEAFRIQLSLSQK